MGRNLQLILILSSIFVFVYVINKVAKKEMNIRYSILWVLWSLVIIFISLFPGIVFRISSFIGIEIPSNTVFLFAIFLLYCMSFYIFLVISKHNNEIIGLNYEIANLKKEIDELKK